MKCFCVFVFLFFSIGFGEVKPTSQSEFNSVVKPFFKEFCTSCHGSSKKPKADYKIDDISWQITAGKDLIKWEKALELISLGDMPPEKKKQPSKVLRKQVQNWIAKELSKIGRGHDKDKLALPGQGNRVDHEELFSGKHKSLNYSPARLWRKSPQIYDSLGKNMRMKLAQPLLGMGNKGFQDYSSLLADEATIKTMLRNAYLIADEQLNSKKNRHFSFLKSYKGSDKLPEQDRTKAIELVFRLVFERNPNEEDQYYIKELYEKNAQLNGWREGIRSLFAGLLLSPEYVFRMELGLGNKSADGRSILSPKELAYAVSFSFYDKPDKKLLELAQKGGLKSKADVEREVRRILNGEDSRNRYFNYPMYHQWGGDYYSVNPRLLRFFQEFFGYTNAVNVFKDKSRFDQHHANRLRKDADFFVLNILKKDKDVIRQLLTSNDYYTDPFDQNKIRNYLKRGKEDRHVKSMLERYPDFLEMLKAGKYPGLNSRHSEAYIPREEAEKLIRSSSLLSLPKDQRAGMLTHPAWLVAHSLNAENDPIRRGKWIRENLLADLVPEVPIGVDAKVPEDHSKTLRERFSIVEKEECWRCHKKMNPLGMPFEVYDDFGRFRTRILIGDVETYLKEKKRFDGQKANNHKHLKIWQKRDSKGLAAEIARAEKELTREKPKKGEKNYGQQLRSYEGHMNRWNKELKSLKAITPESRQKQIDSYKERLSKLVEPVPEAKPVDSSGVLAGTGDSKLDGPVKDAVDLAHRLAASDKVRQSVIRHAFRFWMGRNETLQDSATLIAADQAYLKSGGSFKEVVVSLLTSDTFLYRKQGN